VRVNCHVPITLRITGVPTDDQLAAAGTALTRAVAARLAEAERLLAHRHGDRGVTGVEIREPYDQAREATGGYAVPSYDHGGDPVVLPKRQGPLGPYQLPADRDPRDPANPHNTLTAEEMFDLWMRYWTVRHNRALSHEREVWLNTFRIISNDRNSLVRKSQLFRWGKRDVYGPEYQAAIDELDFCRAVTSTAWELKQWLEVKEKKRTPVTLDQVNEAAFGFARGHEIFQMWMEPLMSIFIGGMAGGFRTNAGRVRASPRLPTASEPPPASPRPRGGGPIGRTLRKVVASAMIGVAEAEPATGMPTGSPTAIEQPQRPPAAEPAPAPVQPTPAPEPPSEAGPVAGAPGGGTPAAGTRAPAAASGGAGQLRLRMFHGTEQGGYQGIGPLNTGRIDVTYGSADEQDLGQGFYLALDVPTAESYATERGKQRGGSLQHVLAFNIPVADLGVIVDIRPGGNFRRQWEDFLDAPVMFRGVRIPGSSTNRALFKPARSRSAVFNHFLDTIGMKNADTIIAPLGDDVFTGIGEGVQVCIRSQRVADRLNQQIQSGE
jgi:hypothetical protein